MKKLFLLSTVVLLLSGNTFAQTGKDGKGKAKDSTSAVKKPMPNCPGKVCGKKKGS